MSSNYFDTITDASAFKKNRPPGTTSLNEIQKLPAGSKWSDDELFAARLVVRSATARSEVNHLLPDLRDHFAEAATACNQTRIRELLKPADASHGTLTETELVHLHGASLGSFWAALAQFGHLEGREVEAKDDGVDEVEDEDVDMCIGAGEGGGRRRPYSPGSNPSPSHKRSRKQRDFSDYDDSSKMRVGSSPYSESSSQQASQGSGYVSQGRPSADVPEQGTVQIASAFIRHVLQACPPQHETQRRKPTCLVEFWGKSRKLAGKTAQEEKVRATADGELVLYQHGNGRYNLTGHRPALLEAKKRFAVIKDGEPAFTNEFLGQMTCKRLRSVSSGTRRQVLAQLTRGEKLHLPSTPSSISMAPCCRFVCLTGCASLPLGSLLLRPCGNTCAFCNLGSRTRTSHLWSARTR